MKITDTIFSLEFTARELRSLPPFHAGFTVASCLAITEITTIMRLVLMASSTQQRGATDDVLKQYVTSQLLILERILSAKALEYLHMLEDHRKKCERKGDQHGQKFHEGHIDRLAPIRASESYRVAKWFRDKVTSHYNISEIFGILEGFPDDHVFGASLHKKDGNSLYALGEEIAVLGKLSQSGGPYVQLDNWRHWVLDTCAVLLSIHHGFMSGLLQDYFPEKHVVGREIHPEEYLVGVVGQTSLPVLWDFAEYDGRRT